MALMMPDPMQPVLHAEHPLDLFTVHSFRLDASLLLGMDFELFGDDDLVVRDETDLERQARLAAAADIIADDPDYYTATEFTKASRRHQARGASATRIPVQRAQAMAGTAVTA